MKYLPFVLYLFSTLTFAGDELFKTYQHLSKNLKSKPNDVIAFIDEENYLSDRLRYKYLNYLTKNKKWADYLAIYKANNSNHQYCQYLRAYYHEKSKALALKKIAGLWQKEDSLPKACTPLVNVWQASDDFDNDLRYEKFTQLMKKKKVHLAKKHLKKLSADNRRYANQWLQVYKNPYRVKNPKNNASDEYKDILAFGLKNWAKRSPDGADKQYQKLDKQFHFNQAQKQFVYETIALYAALRKNPKASAYFDMLNTEDMGPLYHEWRARDALRHRNWTHLNLVILAFPETLKNKPCWQYWLARSYEKTEAQDKAIPLYEALAKNRQYYGFLASFRLKTPVNLNQKEYEYDVGLIEDHQETIDEIKALYQNDKVDKASLLSHELSNDLNEEELYLFAKALSDINWHHKALYYTNKSRHMDDLDIRFPLGYQDIIEINAKNFDIAPAFIFAIIRQESTFRKGVKSHAGALGLMQVIPSTAKKMAKKHKVPLKNMKHMYQPKTNIKIGTAYLNHLKNQFDGHPILMAAAYNAGPNQVKKWLRQQDAQDAQDADIWIETLPWHETRNYLKNVMSFLTIYQNKLGEEESIWVTPI